MLPFILLGAAALAGAYGAKNGVDAHGDNKRAKGISESAESTFKYAESALKLQREVTTETLESLGRLKLGVWKEDLARFVTLYGRLHPIELINRCDTEAGRIPVTTADIGTIVQLSGFAKQALTGGGLALGAGALAGVAAYGGAVMFAAASTGTAISALAGAAATNATLAWFGGGALAAGGMGMAGGMAVLGGIVAGPVLAIGGAVFAAMARENLANAKANYSEANRAASQMRTATTLLKGIERVAAQFESMIESFRDRFTGLLDDLDAQIYLTGSDYREYSKEQRQLVHLVVLAAQTMKALLETPFLTKDGALRRDFEPSLTAASRMLQGTEEA